MYVAAGVSLLSPRLFRIAGPQIQLIRLLFNAISPPNLPPQAGGFVFCLGQATLSTKLQAKAYDFIIYLNPPSTLLKPLALSQFSLRAAERPWENWSAAPSTPRCICRRQRFGVLAPALRARPGGALNVQLLLHPEAVPL